MKTYCTNDNTCLDMNVFRYKPVKIQHMEFEKIESKTSTLLTPNLYLLWFRKRDKIDTRSKGKSSILFPINEKSPFQKKRLRMADDGSISGIIVQTKVKCIR